MPLAPPFLTTSRLTRADRWVHFQARWAIRRGQHRVPPGLYALGQAGAESLVFVTANYALSFDTLRSALQGRDAYILVLDTQGINVWCAAGKGTFGTAELVHQLEACQLGERVRGRVLILPQLGAPGVAAHEVRRRCGFRVEYGPVRAEDLAEYLRTRQATPAMRQARFNLADRLELVPVELVHVFLPLLLAAVGLFFLGGWLPALAGVLAILAGAALFPLLLPWLPGVDFSIKGFGLGLALMLPFGLSVGLGRQPDWLLAAAVLVGLPPVTAFLALNFTGSTPFTSRSGVQREISTYGVGMAVLFGAGLLLLLAAGWLRWSGRI